MARLTDIAKKIDTHLKRFGADKKINKETEKYNTRPYYNANARQVGNRVQIYYVTYEGATRLTKTEAERYLAWLDAGNVGKDHDCKRDLDFEMPKTSAKSCTGCGETLSRYCAFVWCGTGEIPVCPGRRRFESFRTPSPKKTCARKAREKLALCPGCDAEDTTPGTICHDCKELLNRYQGLGDNEVEGYTLDDSLIEFNDVQLRVEGLYGEVEEE